MDPDDSETPFALPQDVPPLLQDAKESLYHVIGNASGVRRNMQKILHLIARCINIIEDLKYSISSPPSTFEEMIKTIESVRKLEILLVKFDGAVSKEASLPGSLNREMMETWGSSRNELCELLKEGYDPEFKHSINWEKDVEQVSRLDDYLWVSLIAQDMRGKGISEAREAERTAARFLEGEQVPSNLTTVIEELMRDWETAAGLNSLLIFTDHHGSRYHPSAMQPNVWDDPSFGAIEAPSADLAEGLRPTPAMNMPPKYDIEIIISKSQSSPNFPSPALPSDSAPWLIPSVDDLLAQFKLEGILSEGEPIGYGYWSTCHKGRLKRGDSTAVPVAIKKLRNLDPGEGSGSGDPERRVTQEIIKRESIIAKVARNPNILPFFGYQINNTDVVLICPWCQNGNLDEYKAKHRDLKDIDKLKLLWDAAQGLAYLHSLKPPIVHGDIKPQNVIIKDDLTAALHSFECSIVVDEPPSGVDCLDGGGTLHYLAPERVLRESELPTNASDVYAFGGLILTTMSGKHPFHQIQSLGRVIIAIVAYEIPEPPHHSELSEHDPLWNLLKECWSRQPTDRPSALGVVRMLEEEIQRRSETEGDAERS